MRLSRYFHYDSFKITTFCFLKRDDERRISRYCPHSLPSLKVVFSNFITLKKIPELSGPPQWLSGKETTCGTGDTGDVGSIPGSGRPPGGGHGNPLQYFCLENPKNREACGLQSVESWRVRHNRSDLACMYKLLLAPLFTSQSIFADLL